MEYSKKLLQNVILGANLGFWDWNYQTGEHDVNDLWLSMLGLDISDIKGSEIDWSERIHLDDRPNVNAAVQQAIDKDIPYRVEFRMRHKNDFWVWIEGSGRVVEWDKNNQKPIRLCGTHQDISERKKADEMFKESEERNQVLFDSSPDGILVTNKASRKFMYANPTICDLLGYSESELTSMSVLDIHPKKSLDYVLYEYELQASGKKLVAGNIPCQKKDGSIVMVDINTAMITLNEVECMIGFFRDITERKLVEEELLRARKLESVGLLAGGIAHDFNNVLTGLFGNIELAKQKLGPDHAAHTNSQNADQALDKVTTLTKQLLTPATGAQPILEMINIGHIIQDSIKFSLSGSNVKTTLNLPDELWQINADKGQLSQVITNLVINADQAMPTGGTLTIEAENIKNIDNNLALYLSGEVIKLSIADDGSGISTENQKLIFDPYFTTKQAGSGLGLATVHSIITKHMGHISVVSELGIGTTFTIYLPADSSIPKTTGVTYTDLVETPNYIASHILVMDDDKMILNLSSEIIETFGYTVETAVDGEEAIEKYISAEKSGKPFDVVIMDLTIPGGMGGKDTVKEILAIDPEAKAIVSSGYSTDPIMANYGEYGFMGRLVKPFQIDELQKELSRHITQE